MTKAQPELGLRRELGLRDATFVVVGAIIGVGIFFTPSRVAKLAGSGDLALLAWALGGAIALFGALTFAELGGLYPRSGGQYEILRDAYGPLIAFVFVFCNATAIQAGAIGIIAVVCANHLATAAGVAAPGPTTSIVLALFLIVVLTVTNVVGVRWGARVQNATVYAKLATLLAVFALAAWPGWSPAAVAVVSAEPPLGWWSALFAALVPTLFSYGGWQQALWIGGEVREPGRNVPRAIIIGVLIVLAAYMAVNWAYLRLLGDGGVAASSSLAADAVAARWPALGSRAIAGAVALSAFGVLNAQLLTGPRLVYAMARDGRFFAPFARVHAAFGTPLQAIALLGGVAVGLLLAAGAGGIDQLLTGVVFVDGIFFVLTGAALFVLRRRRPDAERPVRVPGFPVVPALFVLGESAVVVGAYRDPAVRGAAMIGGAWIVAAAVLYIVVFRNRDNRAAVE